MDHPPTLVPRPNLRRRTFIGRAVTTMAAASAGLNFVAAHGTQLTPYEGCKASASDSLFLYIELLLNVQAEAFFGASGEIIAASSLCSTILKRIQDQVKVLQKEIENSRAITQVGKLNDIVQAGSIQADVLNASIRTNSPSKQHPLVDSMKVLSNHMTRAVQDLLPQGEIKLTGKAKAALEELLRLVKAYENAPEEVHRAQEAYQSKVLKIQQCINDIRSRLFDASDAAVDAERASGNIEREKATAKAVELVDVVTSKLDNLRKGCCGIETGDMRCVQGHPSPATDLLISVLEGTKSWIQNPKLISRLDQRHAAVQFANANFVEAPAFANLYAGVWDAIEKHCPRATPYKVGWCVGLILGPLGFNDLTKRVSLIAGVLVLYPCWHGNKDSLCEALAALG